MKQTLQKIKSVIMELHKTYPHAHDEPYVSRRRVIEEIEVLEEELRQWDQFLESKGNTNIAKHRQVIRAVLGE